MKNYILFCFFTITLLHGLAAQDFINPLFIPESIMSSDTNIVLDVVNSSHNFNPNGNDDLNTWVPTLAVKQINGNDVPILGPTIAGQYKKILNRDIYNGLTETTSFHWHGAHAAPDILGGPHHILQPQDIWAHPFEVIDAPSTMWYHPLDIGSTYNQTQLGFAGMVYFEDREMVDPSFSMLHEIFPHQYGVNDFPIILQTKKFDKNDDGVTINTEEEYTDGYEHLVNATLKPFLDVGADIVLLRLLNADAKFSFLLQIKDDYGNFLPMNIIATDAGYTTKTIQTTQLLIVPGERYEIALDLRGLDGEKWRVETIEGITDYQNSANLVDPKEILELRTGESQVLSSITSLNFPLIASEKPEFSGSSDFELTIDPSLKSFDGAGFDLYTINRIVDINSVEGWTITNDSAEAVPFHLQGNHFWVEEIVDQNGNAIMLPDALTDGPKDNILIPSGASATIVIRFSDYSGVQIPSNSYAYHSNNLHHLDAGLMGQYVVWDGVSTATIDEEQSTREMTVFPNPAQTEIVIKGESSKESTVLIYNLQGQLLKDFSLPSFSAGYKLNIDDLSSGMLIVEWNTAEGRAISRVMKK